MRLVSDGAASSSLKVLIAIESVLIAIRKTSPEKKEQIPKNIQHKKNAKQKNVGYLLSDAKKKIVAGRF